MCLLREIAGLLFVGVFYDESDVTDRVLMRGVTNVSSLEEKWESMFGRKEEGKSRSTHSPL